MDRSKFHCSFIRMKEELGGIVMIFIRVLNGIENVSTVFYWWTVSQLMIIVSIVRPSISLTWSKESGTISKRNDTIN